MAETTQRVLRLLGLLEARTTWQAHELATRLEVTERTVRRDVTRLRQLGYPVEAARGLDGGYRLGAGRRLPPLLLDDDEAVALVACLRMGALSGTDDVGEAALRALTKLDQLLPPRLHSLVAAVDGATRALPRNRPAVDLHLLQQLATAQRDHMLVRFDYRKPTGEVSSREVEPVRLMTQGEHWYLQGFDRVRDDWRVFRLDRVTNLRATTWQFAVATAQRDHMLVRFDYRKPTGEVSSREVEPVRLMTQGEHWYLQGFDRVRDDWRVFRLDRVTNLRATTWQFAVREAPPLDFRRDLASRYPCRVRVEMGVDVEKATVRIPAPYRSHLEPTARGCRFLVGAPDWDDLAWHVLWVSRDLKAPVTVLDGADADPFREAMARISDHAREAS